MRLEDVADEYFYEKIVAEETKRIYYNRIQQFNKAIKYSHIRKITKKDVLLWRDSMMGKGIRNTTINNYIRHCKTIWHYACKRGYVSDKGVFTIYKLPEIKIKKTINQSTISYAYDVIDAFELNWFWKTLVCFQAETGVRNRQLRNIKVSDLDLIDDTVFLSSHGNKTKTFNTLPLSPKLTQQLAHYMVMSERKLGRKLFAYEYLFVISRYSVKYKQYQTNRMSASQLQSFYVKVSKLIEKETGERISGHRLRHTLASVIGSQANVNIRVIQEFFGWECIQTAQGYVQVSVEQKRELLGLVNKFD